MKRIWLKVITASVAAIMSISLGACKADNNNVKQSSGGSSTTTGGVLPIVEKTLTLKVLTPTRADMTLGNDMPFYKELEKRTNIHLDFSVLPLDSKEASQKFNLIMASGDLPDIVNWGTKMDIVKYGSQGAFVPLEDLINKYAPNIKSVLDNPPIDDLPYKQDLWKELTAGDGHIYNVPTINPSNAIGPVYGIRTDWLTKLNLKTPDTVDDLYNVLKAFKEKDPNGNGKADEIPFVGDPSQWNSVLPFVNLYDGHMDLYLDKKDNKIKFGPMENAYKDGIQFINKLFSEGLIDKEYATVTRDQWLAKTTGNLGGMIFAWPGSGFGPINAALTKVDSKSKFEPIVPSKGISGNRYKDAATSGTLIVFRASITSANKHQAETMKWLDYFYSKEGYMLCNYGIEGTHYTMVNGQPKYTDYVLSNKDGKSPEIVKVSDGLKPVFAWWNTWQPEIEAFQQTAPWTVDAWNKYKQPGIVEPPLPGVNFTEEQTSTLNRKLTDIRTYRDQTVNQFIMGQQPLSKFSEFVDNLKKMGIDDCLKIYNDAYQKYLNNSAKK